MSMRKHINYIVLSGLTISIILIVIFVLTRPPENLFSGQCAYQDVITQVGFGPRTPGSIAHARTVAWIQDELEAAGWLVVLQEIEYEDHLIKNITATRTEETPKILLGAHYDSRLVADRDPGSNESVPGANDGASGVSILLELARTLPSDTIPISLVFFDAEDNGNLPGWDWLVGSRAYAATLSYTPEVVVIVDMIGDADLQIYRENSSSPDLVDEIWMQAARSGYQAYFINTGKFTLLDDHTPFLEAGIPAAVIIDFDYPYWHTNEDTIDKVSPESLEIVGKTLWTWIVTYR